MPIYLSLLFAHGTIVRHRQVKYWRKKIAIIIIATEIKEYEEKKVKKICRHGHLPARLNLPAWPSSQSQFAGMPATAGDLAPMQILDEYGDGKAIDAMHTNLPKSVLPMRICEKVGFFLGTDNATAEGGTSLGGMLPRKIFKISMQIELFYSILGNNSLYFHC